MITELKDLIFKTIVLAHGTSRSNFNNILAKGEMVGDISPNWNVSDEWVYFWNSLSSIKDVLENDDELIPELSDRICEVISDAQNQNIEYSEAGKIVFKLLSVMPKSERDDFSDLVIYHLLEGASQSADFSLDGCELGLKSILIFDGRDMNLDVDLSCDNMEGATRVPSPVAISHENGYLGVAEQAQVHKPSNTLKEAIFDAVNDIDINEYYTEDEINRMNKIRDQLEEEYDDVLEDELYSIQDEARDREFDLSDIEIMSIYHTYYKILRNQSEYNNVVTLNHTNNSKIIKRRREIAQIISLSGDCFYEEEYFDNDNYIFTKSIPHIVLDRCHSITK